MRHSKRDIAESRYLGFNYVLNTGNAFGSVDTKIRIVATSVTNTNADITFANNASNGATWTINVAGFYYLHVTDDAENIPRGACTFSVSSTALTTNASSLTAPSIINFENYSAGSRYFNYGIVRYLRVGDVVRVHTDAYGALTSNGNNVRISRIR